MTNDTKHPKPDRLIVRLDDGAEMVLHRFPDHLQDQVQEVVDRHIFASFGDVLSKTTKH